MLALGGQPNTSMHIHIMMLDLGAALVIPDFWVCEGTLKPKRDWVYIVDMIARSASPDCDLIQQLLERTPSW